MRQAPLSSPSPQGSWLRRRKCPTGCACGPTPPCEAGEFLQSQPSSNIIAWNKRRWGASATAAGCPMDGERGQARAFSRGARGGNPSQKIDRVAKRHAHHCSRWGYPDRDPNCSAPRGRRSGDDSFWLSRLSRLSRVEVRRFSIWLCRRRIHLLPVVTKRKGKRACTRQANPAASMAAPNPTALTRCSV